MEPTHKVTVTFTLTVPHELADNEEDVRQVFDEEICGGGMLYVTDDEGEDQEIEWKADSYKWTEL